MIATLKKRNLSLAAFISAAIVLLLYPSPSTQAAERFQKEVNVNSKEALTLSPSRIELDVTPGKQTTFQLTVFNDSTSAKQIEITSSDFGPSSDPRTIGQRVEKAEYGAGRWLIPEIKKTTLKPFEEIKFGVFLKPPQNAAVGTNMGSIIVSSSADDSITDSGIGSEMALLSQIFLTVPGPVKHDLRITGVTQRDAFILGRHRVVTWDVRMQNRGTVNEHVRGTVNVKNAFGGNAARIKIDDMLILRGGTRVHRVMWKGLPWVGAFTPEVEIRGDDAKKITQEGPRVVILPIWLPIALFASVLLPSLWVWRKRRKEWKAWLEEHGDELELSDAPDADDTYVYSAHDIDDPQD